MPRTKRHTYIVTDLGYGDAGKGSIVDYLTRQAQPNETLVIRHNGGAQAAHNVVTPDGQHHRFSQFGAGSLVPGTKTHLSRFMLVDLYTLHDEANKIALQHNMPDIVERLTIDEDALLVTPYQQAANRLREVVRGNARHGSCGMGIGEAMFDSLNHSEVTLHVGDICRPNKTRRRLELQRQLKIETLRPLFSQVSTDFCVKTEWELLNDDAYLEEIVEFYCKMATMLNIVSSDYLPKTLDSANHVIFEGAQGVLLDEWRGFHPYTTWSTTTHNNALTLLAEANFDGGVTRLGLLRAYATRHGAGPLPTESCTLTSHLPDIHNQNGPWQQHFRVGYFDAVTAKYALEAVGGADKLVLTCVDRLYGRRDWKIATHYLNKCSKAAINYLPLGPFADLDYQTQLTLALQNYQPQYQTAVCGTFTSKSVQQYVDILQTLLHYPVGLISTGPTANDKQVVKN